MKLAIIGDEISQDLNTVISTVKQMNFKGIEVRSVWNKSPDQLTKNDLYSIKDSIKKENLDIIGFDSACFKGPFPKNEVELENYFKNFMESIEKARILDAKFLRIFTFFREGEPDPKKVATVFKDLKTLIPTDIQIYIETGMKTNTPTIKDTITLIEESGLDNIGILWDPGNTVYAGIDSNPFPNDYELGKDLIKHIHIKDPIGQEEYVKIGDGNLPWKEIISTLKENKYEGWLSLETHWRKTHILSQQIRDKPWFDIFSNGGLEASIECMEVINNYIKEEMYDINPK